MTRRQAVGVFAIAVVLATAIGGGIWATTRDHDGARWHGALATRSAGLGPGMMGGAGWSGARGGGMMGGTAYGIEGTGRVTSLDAARSAAQRYADTLGLEVGEVMQFSKNYYAELVTPSGDKATEVLVDPATGAVRVEYGPAMMWNTTYGMHTLTAPGPARVSADQARQVADRWLAQHQAGTTAGEADVFPGYYTLHTLRDGAITGMLSVNATTGAVWYHSWHGDFVAMSES